MPFACEFGCLRPYKDSTGEGVRPPIHNSILECPKFGEQLISALNGIAEGLQESKSRRR